MVRYDRLEMLMRTRGVNRTELAKELGISSRTMAKIGKGLRLSPIVLSKIASFFGCSPADLFEEVHGGALPVRHPAERAFTQSPNSVYIIDDGYRVVGFNEQMGKRYPDLRKGDVCYSAIMKQPEVCRDCPLSMEAGEDLNFYNAVIGQWVSIRRSEIDYPGAGHCNILSCRRSMDMQKDIRSRLPAVSGYDVYIEMNLTKNCYRIILPDDPAPKMDFSKESLKDLIRRTAENLVHPEDKDAFLEFWDIRTLAKRINGPEHKIHGVFRECRKSGTWDTIYITIVQEEYYGTSDVMIMALYMIIPGRSAETAVSVPGQEVYAGGRKLNFDYMTGLPLRRSYWELIEKSLLSETHERKNYCVLATDIEHFHIINNWYGRAAGDALLAKIGAFLKKCEQERDMISGYMGGDNFCTIFPYTEETFRCIVDGVTEIVAGFKEDTGFRPLFGVCSADLAETTGQDAYDHCIMALERGTGSSGNVFRYDERMIEERRQEEELLFRFEKGLKNGELTFYLQPRCDITTGRIVGAEALARWICPELGLIPPDRFIPALEKAGRIGELDYYIWESVCKTVAKWRAAGLPVLPVSVNVSRADVFSMDIVHGFTLLTERYRLDPKDIEIEITESAYAENDSIIREVQSGLKDAGFHILIDDFGSGYSSLNFLRNVDADAIKLDMRFLHLDEENAEKGTNILSSVLELAEKIEMAAVTEGVETKEQADFLAYKGCRLAQGYYFYRPMPVAEYEKLLADPERIKEGVRLSDYRADRDGEADPGVKSFRGFGGELEEYVRALRDVAAFVRVVDPGNGREYRPDAQGHISLEDSRCCDIRDGKRNCAECISAAAVKSGKAVSKYETVGGKTYYVIAKPVLIGGKTYAVESAIGIEE